ncbi:MULTISPECIES: RraA family protein [unclassified Pseudomonas]|uniref:RraA family protein n=1 Tax=unclassified Pseudomonas TaxID=196821 RepID=UPI000BC3AF95|nr:MULTISPECIES: RraA family protein [unclassified Pseudomonas]PVZ12675.1 regulator of RNase E activity RraA [Pseudomonas sp. URIL14HWK12:I12]PVZ23174.1 regulator of RNase E activity RraA [Pseudomonas sp. URIL14HWK12:I10]PVZ32503.1 regulator of RNase E activity RraA [Pseudomonas sp. URIL14HWK12:I11]SNZ13554.1 Regulator of RNase E activity RraA [Pseudomonas sp. URIL14HWK12:I9]
MNSSSSAAPCLVEAYRPISSSTIGHFGRDGHLPGLMPLAPNVNLVGHAFCVQVQAPDGAILRDALIACPPGAVLVVACDGEPHCACWGELRSLAALVKGVAGVVIDGPVTDTRALRQLPLPVFCTGASAYTTRSIGEHGSVGQPVQLAGVWVRPGDLIVGDDDGVQVLSQERAWEMLGAFEQKQRQDAERRDGLFQRWQAGR